MKIFTRTRKLVSATLHDWFDRLERPEQMARHGLRELGTAIESATGAVARSIAAERWLQRRRDEQQKQVEHWDRRATEAVRGGAETAARHALAQKFELTRTVERLDQQIGEAADINRGLRSQLDVMRERYQRAENQVDVQTARHTVATATREFADSSRSVVGTGAALGDLQRALDRIERSTLEAEVQAELTQDASAELEQQFAERQRNQFVDAELERLRTTKTDLTAEDAEDR